MKSQAEFEAERRIAAGLPVLVCPNCGRTAAHWVPERIEDDEYQQGYFTCRGAA
jgi:hypothetical protein